MPNQRPAKIEALLEAPWALLPSTLSRIVDWTRSPSIPARVVALEGPHDGAVRSGSVAVVPVYGVIEHRADWMTEMLGGTSVESLRASLASALADPAVSAVVLDIDSPGGSVAGVTELASEIRAARGGAKPIVAVANSLAASAAYWLASQADEVVVTPSGQVGSIGVYAIHQDISRMLDEMGVTMTLVSAGEHKTEGNEFEPLSADGREEIQSRVDATYRQFLADVAAGRRVTAGKVESDFGGGRVLSARKALDAGMVDRVESLGQAVQRVGRAGGTRKRAMAAEGLEPGIVATDGEPMPFGEQLADFVAVAETLVGHAQERARLRAKEGRPAFSTTTEKSLRAIRDAIDGLLALDDPAPTAPPADPAPAVPTTPPVAVSPYPRLSHGEWLAKLEAMTH